MATGSSQAASPDTELCEDDLGALHEALYSVRYKCRTFGLQIGLLLKEIKNIEKQEEDHGERLLEILSLRLNKATPLTWNDIDRALKSDSVNEKILADNIRAKYVHQPSPDPSTEGPHHSVSSLSLCSSSSGCE